jgi:fumarylpyruvate hydrolase
VGIVAASRFIFAPVAPPAAVIAGSEQLFPVNRIFCVGRNYADHAKEMGVEIDREAPFYFLKPATALVANGATVPYPPGTSNYHYEMELVVAIGTPAFKIETQKAETRIFGYACGLDMTRRDLQLAARETGRPWDLGKAFEQSAVLGAITPSDQVRELGPKRITLSVNGTLRQNALLADMIWSVPEIIAHLSRYYHLAPGDLIFTGTPAGVGPVVAGDQIEGVIEALEPVTLAIEGAE